MALRAVSNLKTPEEFELSREERRSGFLHFYAGRQKEEPAAIIYKLLFQPFIPEVRTDDFPKDKKETLRGILNLGIGGSAKRSKLKKNIGGKLGDGFIFESPIYFSGNLNSELNQYAILKNIHEAPQTGWKAGNYNEGFIEYKAIENFVKTSTATHANLKKCLLGLRVEIGSLTSVWARWFISRKEAEYLTSTKFVAIRQGNLYVMLMHWVESMYGHSGAKMPMASIPISFIAGEVKKQVKVSDVAPRSVGGIVAMADGRLLWLPEVDNSIKYEEALSEYGLTKDGSYTFHHDEDEGVSGEFKVGTEGGKKRKLPSNMPILLDWVNLKFAFSNTNGVLSVIDLNRSIPLRPFHIRHLLDHQLLDDDRAGPFALIQQAIKIAGQIDGKVKAKPTDAELDWGRSPDYVGANNIVEDIAEYAEDAIHRIVQGKLSDEIGRVEDVKVKHLAEDSPLLSLRCIGRAIKQSFKVCTDNLDNVFDHYSVRTTIEFMAIVKLFSLRASKYDEVAKTDEEERKIYTTQGLDPKHKIEALPNIKNDFTLHPHQAKIENVTRHNPKTVILDVDAGGGKTLASVVYAVKQMKKGNAKRVIVVCPSHLMANYVKDTVFLSAGKINVIPINSLVIKHHGFKRIKKMLEIAPVNTIVITNYDFLSRSNLTKISYGLEPIVVFNNLEFLRQFAFDMVIVDEVHNLKNADSTRTEAVHRFISEIPYKVLMSGTLVKDTAKDLVGQFALADPTVFGDESQFMKEFAAEIRGGKAMRWKPNAEQEIRKRMKEHAILMTVRRKEWAVLLPNPIERFHIIGRQAPDEPDGITPNQVTLYESILAETLELIQAEMDSRPELKKAIEEAEDENKFDDLARLLRPYLARLESCLAAPAKDKLGDTILKEPEDRLSPKAKKVIEICRHHFGTKINKVREKGDFYDEGTGKWKLQRKEGQALPGKILILTEHLAVAEDIFNSLPQDLKAQTIHYTAGKKIEAIVEFEKNPRKNIMIGVVHSMKEGLNLQFCSRQIFIEVFWTPGDLEQTKARINRPRRIGEKELRKNIFYDYLVVDGTFDITKTSRLIAKIVSKTKFDEAENAAYQDIPNLALVPMTLKNISEANSFGTHLVEYLEGYQAYRQVLDKDYDEYRIKHKDLMEPIEVPTAGNMPGSKLMPEVPYIPDMELFGEDELGLVRYDEYVGKEIYEDDEGSSEDDSDEDEIQKAKDKLKEEAAKVVGMGVHTQWGDGVIESVRKNGLRVNIRGYKVRVRKLAAFIITKKNTSAKDMRVQLLKLSGEIPIDKPLGTPSDNKYTFVGDQALKDKTGKIKIAPKPAKEEDDEELPKTGEVEAELELDIVNDFLALTFKNVDDSETAAALSQYGFKHVPPYAGALVKNPQSLYALFKAWKDKGFSVRSSAIVKLKAIYDMMKSKKYNTFGMGKKMDLKTWYFREFKPSNDPILIKPYPIMRQGQVYIVMPLKGQIATQKAVKVTVPGIKWTRMGGDEMMRFVYSKPEAAQVIKQLVKSGVSVPNAGKLMKQLQKMTVLKREKPGNEDD